MPPYRLPPVTYKEFRDTLEVGYGVKFTPQPIAPEGTKWTMRAVHCKRILGDRELEAMYIPKGDGDKMGWDTIDHVCRLLHINPSEDQLWGLEI